MKNTILSIAIILFALTGKSQSKEFAAAMGEALGQYATCKTINDFQVLGNKFGMIANAEKSEWLPLYYHAHCYILMSFMEPTDVAKRDEYLDVAEKSIEKMLILAPKESEAYTLQGFCYTARLVINPMERGQEFSMLSSQSIGKALSLDPENPRAKVLKLQNEMGAAQFFGKDPSEYCGQANELLAKWDDYKPKSPLYPVWGKNQAAKIVEGCKAGK
jgi:hypothetical protein